MKNQGTADSPPFSYDLYLSTDATISRADYLAPDGIDAFLAPALAAGDTCTVTRIVHLPATPPAGFSASGAYYFGTMIDPGNAVAELDEGNNQEPGGRGSTSIRCRSMRGRSTW